MDGDKHFLCTILSAREYGFLKKMSDDIYYIPIIFFKSMVAPKALESSKAESATITLLSLHIQGGSTTCFSLKQSPLQPLGHFN